MHDHINAVKGKCEAITQSILSILKHKYLREQDMATIMQLHDACTVPTLLYGSEAWIPTKDETTKIEAIVVTPHPRNCNPGGHHPSDRTLVCTPLLISTG